MTATTTAFEFRRGLREIEGEILYDEPLAPYTSFRIGGRADVLVLPRGIDELRSVLLWTRKEGVPFFLLGGGCNILIRDGGVRGVAVCLKHFSQVRYLSPIPTGMGEPVLVSVESGKDLARLLGETRKAGFSGLEFTAGIPGSLGGALIMNAGSFGGEMKDVVQSLTVMDHQGEIHRISGVDAAFGYRSSHIPGKVILGAVMQLRRGDPDGIREKIHQNLIQKKKIQPVQFPSAGSVFKNAEGVAAWKLIDEAGFRGTRIGGAQVSEMHANYIVNRGSATARDVLELVHRIGRKVERDLGVTLELEIRIVGEG